MNLRKGTEVIFKGEVIYRQDFSTWKNDFGNKIFYFVKKLHNDLMVFESEGYGLKHNYGNGKIYIIEKDLKNKIIINK
jgi:hypothetical protein